MYTSGTLEITEHGFGFVRQDHRLAGSGPILVVQSQIRRYRLQGGDKIKGQVRPPNVREQYFSFITIEEISGQPAR